MRVAAIKMILPGREREKERLLQQGEVLFAGSGREPLNCCNTIVAKMSIITTEMAEAEGREEGGTVGVANGAS